MATWTDDLFICLFVSLRQEDLFTDQEKYLITLKTEQKDGFICYLLTKRVKKKITKSTERATIKKSPVNLTLKKI